jgi:hypothetical protein
MQPGNGTYTQPQGAPGTQPSNTGFEPQNQNEPAPSYMTAPGANGPPAAAGTPTTPTDQNTTPPTDQNATPQNAQPPANSNNPGPSS